MKNNKIQDLLNRICWLVLALLPLTAIAQDTKNEYTIEGRSTKWASVTLQYSMDGKRIENTADVKNGAFKLTGNISSAIQAGLLIRPANNGTSGNGSGMMASIVRLWLEPGRIEVNNLDSVGKISFSGSPLNDDQNELAREEAPLASRPANMETDGLRRNIVIKFIKAHPNSLVSLTALSYSLSRGVPDLTVVDPLFNNLSADIKASPMGKDYQQKLNRWKIVDIGSPAPDFSQPDEHGKQVKPSDFKGKYVLIDFWASWCHPCRDENPNLITQYNLYKNKNFTILSVSLDGGSKEAKANWLKAIKEDKVGIWPQLCDLSGDSKNNVARNKYGVGSIPENFLIDPDGKIIAKSLRGEELNKKLKEIFGK